MPRPTRQHETIARLMMIGLAAGSFVGVPTAYNMLDAHAAHDAPSSASEVTDTPIVEQDDGTIERTRDGLFHAQARIDGHPVSCLIDSGATGLVIEDSIARRAGAIGPAPRYDGRLVTANGSRPATRRRIEHLALAGHDLHDVQAIVVRGNDTPCLLGQDVLRRLDAVEIHGDEIALR